MVRGALDAFGAIDVLVCNSGMAIYYVLHARLGLGLVTSLTLSRIVPAGRSVSGYLREGEVNALALLMLGVNVARILLTFVSGNARVMFVKNSAISSVVALGIILSVVRGRPLMTAGLKPFITEGDERGPRPGITRSPPRGSFVATRIASASSGACPC